MRSRILCLMTSMIVAGQVYADGRTSGGLVTVDAKEVFVPVGFDDNDETVVVVDGWLPDGCYRLSRPLVEVDHVAQVIKIVPHARWFDIPCIEALIPYSFEVRLGILPYGEYKIEVNKAANVLETLEIAEATNAGPDDHLYAPVDSVTVDRLPNSPLMVGVINGRFTNSCMEWEEIRVIDSGKTVQVMPIIRMEDRSDCVAGIFPFSKSFLLPAGMTVGRHLLHVRSLNGHDVNKMFTVAPR